METDENNSISRDYSARRGKFATTLLPKNYLQTPAEVWALLSIIREGFSSGAIRIIRGFPTL